MPHQNRPSKNWRLTVESNTRLYFFAPPYIYISPSICSQTLKSRIVQWKYLYYIDRSQGMGKGTNDHGTHWADHDSDRETGTYLRCNSEETWHLLYQQQVVLYSGLTTCVIMKIWQPFASAATLPPLRCSRNLLLPPPIASLKSSLDEWLLTLPWRFAHNLLLLFAWHDITRDEITWHVADSKTKAASPERRIHPLLAETIKRLNNKLYWHYRCAGWTLRLRQLRN